MMTKLPGDKSFPYFMEGELIDVFHLPSTIKNSKIEILKNPLSIQIEEHPL